MFLRLFLKLHYFLGPKGRYSIATSVRAWLSDGIVNERRRCGTIVTQREVLALRASLILTLPFHALTDVAIEYRPFGPANLAYRTWLFRHKSYATRSLAQLFDGWVKLKSVCSARFNGLLSLALAS